MPFIEDEWWAAENEGRMVDLSNCLQDAVTGGGQAAALHQMASSLGELSQAEISNIVGLAEADADDPDDILKQLGETAFDNFDTFFTDLTNSTATAVPPIEIKQEENNNISPASGSQTQGSYYQQNQLSLPNNGQQRLQQLLRSGTSAINNAVVNNISNGRYNIASANPLLAEKLAATSSGIKQEPMSNDYNGAGMNYGSASPMQRVPSGKPQVNDAGGGKGKPTFFYLLPRDIDYQMGRKETTLIGAQTANDRSTDRARPLHVNAALKAPGPLTVPPQPPNTELILSYLKIKCFLS
ncbi:unnamed protein product [Parnassius apollo]|uniref:(apollo) hypothetical protein n=1 Tax=Parnassius apollo TaxID=110799 RepID=A0A8S3XR80_PARAO|nr:unnamed protein product [Parnassius apollo]